MKKIYLLHFLLLFMALGNTYSQTNTFQQTGTIGTSTLPESRLGVQSVADFNNDGFNDIAAFDDVGNMRTYLNTPSNPGHFGSSSNTLSFLPNGIRITAGDLDNDGDVDIAAFNGKVYINNGSGTFSELSGVTIKDPGTTGSISLMKIADLNNDGKNDIVWINLGGGTTDFNEVWLNNGTTGNAGFMFYSNFLNVEGDRHAIETGDIDGDGDLDLVSGKFNSGANIWKNDGLGKFTLSQSIPGYSATAQLGDWNIDGHLDLLLYSGYNTFGYRVSLNDGNGNFSNPILINDNVRVNSHAQYADLNGDGLIDATYSHSVDPGKVVLNNGCGLVFQNYELSHILTPANLDNDGKPDLIGITSGEASRIWKNDLARAKNLPAPGNALKFDGINDKVIVDNNTSLDFGTGSFTIEAWIRLNGNQPDYSGIVSKASSEGQWVGCQLVIVDQRFAVEVENESTLIGVNDGLIGTTKLNDGRWHHVAMVRSSNNIKLFVDGFQEANVTNPAISSNINSPDPLLIGAERGSNAFFNGSIDEVRIWNAARTEEELLANRLTTLNLCSPSPQYLVAYYKFDNGNSGANNTGYTAVNDLSPKGNNGRLVNFSLTGSTSNWVASYAMVVPVIEEASNISFTGFTANWSAPQVGQVQNYKLDVSTSPDFSSFLDGYEGLPVSGTSQAITGLQQNTTYYYRVSAEHSKFAGQGGYSGRGEVTLPAKPHNMEATITKSDVSCFGAENGTITITVTGGTAPYKYRLGGRGAFQSSNTFSNLKPGNYKIFYKDGNKFKDFVIVSITQPLPLTSTYSATDATCYGTANGSITVNIINGEAPFQYKLGSNGEYQSSNTVYNLKAGIYKVFFQDAKGCTGSTDRIVVNQPETLNSTYSVNDATCYGTESGSIVVSLYNGEAPFLYKLGKEGEYQSSNTFNNLKAGSYRVFFQDAKGCTGSTEQIIVGQAKPLSSNFSFSNASCPKAADGTISVSPTSGTSPFSYKLSGTSTYQDDNTFTSVTSGYYRVKFLDETGCEGRTDVIYVGTQSTSCNAAEKTSSMASVKPEIKTDLSASIYPNPTTNSFKLKVSGSIHEAVMIRVFDGTGRKLLEVRKKGTMAEFGEQLKAGMYFIEVSQGKKVKTLKGLKVQ